MRSSWTRVGPQSNQSPCKKQKRRHRDIKKEEIGVIQPRAKGLPRTVGSRQKPGEASGTDPPSWPREGTNPAHTLDSDSGLLNCENKFLLF